VLANFRGGFVGGGGCTPSTKVRHGPWELERIVGLKLEQTPRTRVIVKQTSLFEYICILLIVKMGWKWYPNCGLRLGKAKPYSSGWA
jgi:hypothetical protein